MGICVFLVLISSYVLVRKKINSFVEMKFVVGFIC